MSYEQPLEPEERRRRPAIWLALLAVIVALAAGGWWFTQGSADQDDTLASDSATSSATPNPSVTASPTPTKSAKPKPSKKPSPKPSASPAQAAPLPCSPVTAPFVPTRIQMDGITSGAPVLALGRDANGVVGVPPVTSAAKLDFAWDAPGIKPGSSAGTAIFNAHTWPDGTAMGNLMLNGLQNGEQFRVIGSDGKAYCYTVTKREEIPENADATEVYSTTSEPRLVFIVCSGNRYAPGHWSHRTLWWAQPSNV